MFQSTSTFELTQAFLGPLEEGGNSIAVHGALQEAPGAVRQTSSSLKESDANFHYESSHDGTLSPSETVFHAEARNGSEGVRCSRESNKEDNNGPTNDVGCSETQSTNVSRVACGVQSAHCRKSFDPKGCDTELHASDPSRPECSNVFRTGAKSFYGSCCRADRPAELAYAPAAACCSASHPAWPPALSISTSCPRGAASYQPLTEGKGEHEEGSAGDRQPSATAGVRPSTGSGECLEDDSHTDAGSVGSSGSLESAEESLFRAGSSGDEAGSGGDSPFWRRREETLQRLFERQRRGAAAPAGLSAGIPPAPALPVRAPPPPRTASLTPPQLLALESARAAFVRERPSEMTRYEERVLCSEIALLRALVATNWDAAAAVAKVLAHARLLRKMGGILAVNRRASELRSSVWRLNEKGFIYRKGFAAGGYPIVYVRPAILHYSAADDEGGEEGRTENGEKVAPTPAATTASAAVAAAPPAAAAASLEQSTLLAKFPMSAESETGAAHSARSGSASFRLPSVARSPRSARQLQRRPAASTEWTSAECLTAPLVCLIIYTLNRAILSMAPGVEKLILIVDFNGWEFSRQPATLSTVRTVFTLLADHFFGRVERAFVVDAPWYLDALRRLLQPFVRVEALAFCASRAPSPELKELLMTVPRRFREDWLPKGKAPAPYYDHAAYTAAEIVQTAQARKALDEFEMVENLEGWDPPG